MRLFVAIGLTPEVRTRLARALTVLRGAGGPATWVAPENLHLTLKFLGELPDSRVSEALEATRRAAWRTGPFDLEIAGVSAFPERRPRVIAARASDSPPTLSRLAGALTDALAPLGVPREERPFKAHVTLGRIRERPPNALLHAVTALSGERFGDQAVTEIALVGSRLGASGAVYTLLEACALGPRRALEGREPRAS